MPEITDSDGNVILLGDRLARITGDGAVCAIPVVVGTLFPITPQSPIYYDNVPHLRGLILETSGTVTLKFSRSVTADPPANIAAINAAIDAKTAIPAPDMTNHTWIPLTRSRGMDFAEGGVHEVPQAILQAAKASRWLKVDPLGGEITTMKIHPTIAGF